MRPPAQVAGASAAAPKPRRWPFASQHRQAQVRPWRCSAYQLFSGRSSTTALMQPVATFRKLVRRPAAMHYQAVLQHGGATTCFPPTVGDVYPQDAHGVGEVTHAEGRRRPVRGRGSCPAWLGCHLTRRSTTTGFPRPPVSMITGFSITTGRRPRPRTTGVSTTTTCRCIDDPARVDHAAGARRRPPAAGTGHDHRSAPTPIIVARSPVAPSTPARADPDADAER